MSRVCPLLTVFAVVASSGAIHGVWTNRWASPGALERASARLADLPMTLGDWDGQQGELDERQLAVADASGHVLRHYVNRRTGAALTVLLLCGRPGPISVHLPEVCYRAVGYEPVGGRVKCPAPGQGGEFWALSLRKERSAVPEENLRVLYAWNAAGKWEASESPRLAYARHPALYKVLVVRQMARADEALEDDPAVEFLRDLLPPLRKALFPAP
jgi:hypothetical protein